MHPSPGVRIQAVQVKSWREARSPGFSNTTADIAQSIAERFRVEMEETPFECGEDSFQVTVSIGVAQFHSSESPDGWISRADGAMYQAKQRGRNQVVVN